MLAARKCAIIEDVVQIMAKPDYPLKQVLEVKHKRVEDAEKVVKDKIELLKKEQEKLARAEAERDKVKKHYAEKLLQMREEMDQGTTSPKIQQMKAYLKVVQERLKAEDKKVKDQQDQVDIAEKNLEFARQDLARKRQEVDKLVTHEKDWQLELRKEMEVIEGREMDELGNVIFITNKRKKEKL